jgi:spore germination protein YaaH
MVARPAEPLTGKVDGAGPSSLQCPSSLGFSMQRLRHSVLAFVLAVVPVVSVVSVTATEAKAQLPSPTPAASSATGSLSAARIAAIRDSGPPVMQEASDYVASAPLGRSSSTARGVSQTAYSNTRLYREVFGFAYASSIGDPTVGYPSWNFNLLSTVAYFGVHIAWNGHVVSDSGLSTWKNTSGPVTGLIQTAHAHGTKVVLTIIMMDSTSGTPNMCSALQYTQNTIADTVALVKERGVDGVNVDYESNNTTCTLGAGGTASSQSMFTTFIAGLRAALPSYYISVDTYSGAAGYRNGSTYLGFFDIGALANYVDSFFVMAYDMEYSNWDSPPLNCTSFCLGPTAPLTTYLFNDTRAANEYAAIVPASKVIMGIPYYGRKECVPGVTPTTAPPNAKGSAIAADGYLDASTENGYSANSNYQTHREVHDTAGATRWDTFTSSTANCTRELYWDDTIALGHKYDLVINDHLRGIGIWTLSYGGGAQELWDLINLKFGQCSQAAIQAGLTTPQIPGTAVTFTGSALCAGTAQYRFWMQPPGGAFSVVQDYGSADTWTWDTTGQALGTYTFQVDARNLGNTGLDTYARTGFRLALCVTPMLSATPASPSLPANAITVTATVTCQGTPEYRFLVQPPSGSWSIAQDYGSSSTFAFNHTALPYGDYNIGVHVRTAGTTVAYESYTSIPYSVRSCVSTSLSTDKTSPQPTGTAVVLTGAATCDGTPQYRFMVQPPGGSWSVVRDFAATPTFSWVSGAPAGAYNLEVDARSANTAASTMTSAGTSFTLNKCAAVTLATSLTSPQTPGPTVTLTGTATCPGTPEFRFWIHKPDGSVGVVQNYGPASTYTWSTAGLSLGQYGLRVDARNVGATSDYEAVAMAWFVLADPPCTTPAVVVDPATPQGTRTIVSFTSSTTVCPQPLFEFWLLPPGSSTWILGQGYSASPTFRWNTAGAPAGDYLVSAWVEDAHTGSALTTQLGTYDAFVGVRDTLTGAPCATPTLSATPSAPSPAGTQVGISASATCVHANPEFEFWMLPAGTSTWRLVQPYSTNATYAWNSKGAAAGTELFGVWVRDSSSDGTQGSGAVRYDALARMPYAVTTTACTGVTVSTSPGSPAVAGTRVTITATASGCSNPMYEFWMLPAGSSTWRIVSGYSASASYVWNSTGALHGTEQFGVWVRDASSSSAYDVYTSTPFTVS